MNNAIPSGAVVEGSINRPIVIGRITGAYGIHGWVRIQSSTEPREGILSYSPWWLRSNPNDQWRQRKVLDARPHAKSIVAGIDCCNDRNQALQLIGTEIAVERRQLPTLAPGEHYWADLIGLQVRTVDGVALGPVQSIISTGANDVLVIRAEREWLIPYIPDKVLKNVDFECGVMIVDWDPKFQGQDSTT